MLLNVQFAIKKNICSVPFRNLRFLGIPKKCGLSTESAALYVESAATESTMDPALLQPCFCSVHVQYHLARAAVHSRASSTRDENFHNSVLTLFAVKCSMH